MVMSVVGMYRMYAIRKETVVEQMAIKAATRAVKFEEKLKMLESGVRKEYVRIIDLTRRDTKAERKRLEFLGSREGLSGCRK